MTPRGTLFGVGVGPGAPELLTLRALQVLCEADVLAFPRSSNRGRSVAWSIAAAALQRYGALLGPSPDAREQLHLPLTFPMSKEPTDVRPAIRAAVDAIGEQLHAGRNVAFLTEGDASVFSTFGYVRQEALRRWPALAVELIPAVTSITAVAAVAGLPLADGHERIAILPATYGVEDLTDVLRRFDTVVLMKLGGAMPAITEALERAGLTRNAVVVSHATMDQQHVERDLARAGHDRGGCFATLIVKRTDRSGLLVGGAMPAQKDLP